MMQSVEEFIEHHGVKGMRWGVRRGPNRVTTGRKKKESSDYKETVPLRNRRSKELSNRQLKITNERMNLEQRYHKMNPTKVQKGKIIVASILATATTITTAYNFVQSPAGKAMIEAGKKALKKKGVST